MQVVKALPAPFDVDDTLIMSSEELKHVPLKEQVGVKDPLTNKTLWYRINQPMVRLLLEEAAKGSAVIVWSRGGHEWAKAVVEALNITDHVSYIMDKPLAYFDDKDISEWLKYRVYIGPDIRYKNK